MSNSTNVICIYCNDDSIETETTNLNDFLHSQSLAKDGIAVALNDAIVPRSIWVTTQLRDKDRLMIFSAIAGG